MGPFILYWIYLSCVSCVQMSEERYVRHTRFQTHRASYVLMSFPSPSVLTCLSTCSLTKPCKSSLYSKDGGQCELLDRPLDTLVTQATDNTDNKLIYYCRMGDTGYKMRDVSVKPKVFRTTSDIQRIMFINPTRHDRIKTLVLTNATILNFGEFRDYKVIAYDSKHNQLIASKNWALVSINLITRKTILLKAIKATYLAVDSEREALFIVKPNSQIYRMTIKGKEKQRVIESPKRGKYSHITLQPDTQMIYLLRSGKVYRATYEGLDLELVIDEPYSIFAVAVNLDGETIFHDNVKRVNAYNDVSTEETTLAVMSSRINQLIYHGGKLYIATPEFIYIKDLFNNDTVTFETGFTAKAKVVMCLIT